MCLWAARRQPDLLRDPSVALLAATGAAAWLALTFTAMEYWEPKLNVGIFATLLVLAIVVERVRGWSRAATTPSKSKRE